MSDGRKGPPEESPTLAMAAGDGRSADDDDSLDGDGLGGAGSNGDVASEDAAATGDAARAEADSSGTGASNGGGVRPKRGALGWLLGGHGATAWLWLTGVVLVADRITKLWVVENLEYARPVVINPYLDFTRLHNYGAAFSILAEAGGWQYWLFVGLALTVSVVLLIWLWRLPPRGQGWLACALALVMGGALGNVIDRVQYGYVVDFIHAHWQGMYWPAFNIADIAISVGAVMLVLESFVTRSDKEPAG